MGDVTDPGAAGLYAADPGAAGAAAGRAGRAGRGRSRPWRKWSRCSGRPAGLPPEDPVLARLLPDAYRDDPEAAGEFRRYTEQDLRSGKVAAAQTVLATLPAKGGQVRLGPETRRRGCARSTTSGWPSGRSWASPRTTRMNWSGPAGRTRVRPILRSITGWATCRTLWSARCRDGPARYPPHRCSRPSRTAREDRRSRPRRPSGRGVRDYRGPGRQRPPGAVHRDAQRRAVPDVLPDSTRWSSCGCGGRWTTATRNRSSSTTRTPRRRPTRPVPTSRTPVSRATHYVLVSTRDPDRAEFRSFRIVDGVVTKKGTSDRRRGGRPGTGMISPGDRLEVPDSCHRPRPPAVPTPRSDVHGHRGPYPDHPSHLHQRRQVGRGFRCTLAELIGDIDSRHSGLRDRLVDDSGLRRFVNVYLNDEDVRFLGGLETPVSDGDTVTVLPAVAGGQR